MKNEKNFEGLDFEINFIRDGIVEMRAICSILVKSGAGEKANELNQKLIKLENEVMAGAEHIVQKQDRKAKRKEALQGRGTETEVKEAHLSGQKLQIFTELKKFVADAKEKGLVRELGMHLGGYSSENRELATIINMKEEEFKKLKPEQIFRKVERAIYFVNEKIKPVEGEQLDIQRERLNELMVDLKHAIDSNE